jgi:RNA-binding protein 27
MEHAFWKSQNNGALPQAQKELLDAELDFHKKMSSGEDTTDLKRRLGQLQVEVGTQGIHHLGSAL